MKWPPRLKNEARDEAYEYFDANIRRLPRNADGSLNEMDPIFVNTDVDAFRHAYVSGVFTHEYGSEVADLFGRLNELTSVLSPGASAGEKNMDLCNNSVGRKYGQKFRTKAELRNALREALSRGELIVSPDDRRTYDGASHIELDPTKPVIVLDENQTGRNEVFYDVRRKRVLSKNEFVTMIKDGEYPGYSIRKVNGIEIPTSRPDSSETDNLG